MDMPIEAVAYMRTSSAANVGADKDSEKRQRVAIQTFAARSGYEIAADDWFYDAAVSGADDIADRPGFNALLTRIEGNGVRTVIVEDSSRFARDIKAHVLGIAMLRERGVRLLASNGSDLTDDTDEMTEGMLTMMAVFAQIEKKRLVKKLKAARDRKKALTGKCSGRKSYAERNPQLVAKARELKEGRSLRKIAAELAAAGYVTPSGRPYAAMAVRSMLRESAKHQ
jgi:DNA invertase Pin-like site-specific DNA recombinase